MHDWRNGIARAPLHLLAFGVPAAIVAWWFPWYAVVGVSCFRAGQEIDDVVDGRDTIAKGVIDFATSVVIPVIVAALRK